MQTVYRVELWVLNGDSLYYVSASDEAQLRAYCENLVRDGVREMFARYTRVVQKPVVYRWQDGDNVYESAYADDTTTKGEWPNILVKCRYKILDVVNLDANQSEAD